MNVKLKYVYRLGVVLIMLLMMQGTGYFGTNSGKVGTFIPYMTHIIDK
ncbi:hypothetical protein [Lacticaseibacillus paracasei]|nr:hypothetical protein [Lacticaseibacillus paracasei]MDM7530318.1 hypothetical protein [Lacticaseibacillus paracasei]MDM7542638.1 hypothetical protein [Lacticaseibacillus paracasei]